MLQALGGGHDQLSPAVGMLPLPVSLRSCWCHVAHPGTPRIWVCSCALLFLPSAPFWKESNADRRVFLPRKPPCCITHNNILHNHSCRVWNSILLNEEWEVSALSHCPSARLLWLKKSTGSIFNAFCQALSAKAHLTLRMMFP